MQQLCLGGLVFSVLENSAYVSLVHELKTGWMESKGVQRPYSFKASAPLRTLNLSGAIYGVDGHEVLGKFYRKALESEPHQLSDETGNDLGFWVVLAVKETQTEVLADGSAQVRRFDLNLREYAQ